MIGHRPIKSDSARVGAAGVEREATFELASAETADAVSNAYRTKYGRYGARLVNSVMSDEPIRSTLRVVPAGEPSEEA